MAYAKFLGFMAFLCATYALITGGIAWRAWQVYSTGTPTPVDVSLADLSTDGVGGNLHVHVTDLRFGPDYIAESRYGSWTCVWVPVLFQGRVRAVVKTSHVKDEGQLRALCSQPDVAGILTNDLRSLGSAEFNQLKERYPGVNFYALPVVEEAQTFPTAGRIWRMTGVAAVQSVAALIALVIILRIRQRQGLSGEIETAAPARAIHEGSDPLRGVEVSADGVTTAPARPGGGTEVPAETVTAAPARSGVSLEAPDLGTLQRVFPANDLGLQAIGCGVYWLLPLGGIAAITFELSKPGQFYWAYAVLGVMMIPPALLIAVGISFQGISAALYAEGVMRFQGGRTTACRWDEVESVEGMLHVPTKSEAQRISVPLRLRTVDGRTVMFGGVRDADELADAVYREVLHRQLPRALAAIRWGETVSAGPLLFRSDAIGNPGGQWLAWNDVEGVEVRGQKIVVKRYGSKGPWWSGGWEIPNAALLLEFAAACRRGEIG